MARSSPVGGHNCWSARMDVGRFCFRTWPAGTNPLVGTVREVKFVVPLRATAVGISATLYRQSVSEANTARAYRPRDPQSTPLCRLVETFYEEVKGCWEERFERLYGRWRGFLDRVLVRRLR